MSEPRGTDGYLSCPLHGDIFWRPNTIASTPVDATGLEAVLPGTRLPVDGEEIKCPLSVDGERCGQKLRPSLRPQVQRVAYSR